MKKVELLSPVGNRECLEAAIHNGADAVYLSGKKFGARKFAGNFTDSELVEAINYSHLYGVKVYVTVNTIIYEKELEEVLDYLKFLAENNVDAVIMQDIGLIKVTREMLPDLEIHASTQVHNHNNYGIELLKKLGVTRVVLARELSLEEIKKINVKIEREVFVHGALCVSYSGCCLFSSMNGGRSGNRGECVQSCRMPYKFLDDNGYIDTSGDYLLSTRELNTLNNISELIEAGIDSFKIEGRMKSPGYVALVTRLYRTYIDRYYNHEDMTVKDEDIKDLQKLFNRKFTSGYLNNDNNIMNIMTPNHQGIEIGRVIDVNKNKITIKLNDKLSQNDGIRFKNSNKGMIVNKLYNNKGLLINSGKDIVIIDNKINLRNKDIVLKTLDYELENSLTNYEKKKVEVFLEVEAYLGKKLLVRISDNKNTVIYEGNVIEKSKNSPISCERIKYQLSKMGDTVYKVSEIDIKMDSDIFINIKDLNEARRYLVERLNSLRIGSKKDVKVRDYQFKKVIHDDKVKISVLVRNLEQLKAVINNKVDYIYIADYQLYLEYKDKYDNMYYRTSRVNNNYKDVSKVLVTELGGINKYQDKEMVSDYYLNVVNSYSISYLESMGVKRVTMSVEDDYNYFKDINFYNHNVEVIIYGIIELMITKYCPIKLVFNNCKECKRKNNNYYLEDKFYNKYPIVKDDCYTHIMHSKIINRIGDIVRFRKLGINNYRIELFRENYKEVEKIIKDVRLEINGR